MCVCVCVLGGPGGVVTQHGLPFNDRSLVSDQDARDRCECHNGAVLQGVRSVPGGGRREKGAGGGGHSGLRWPQRLKTTSPLWGPPLAASAVLRSSAPSPWAWPRRPTCVVTLLLGEGAAGPHVDTSGCGIPGPQLLTRSTCSRYYWLWYLWSATLD